MRPWIEILLVSRFKYNYENTCAKALSNAFQKLKVEHRIARFDQLGLMAYLAEIKASPPKAILSFQEPFPGEKPLSELLNVPHFYWPKRGFEGSCFPLFSSLSCTITADMQLQGLLKQMGRVSLFLNRGVEPIAKEEKKTFEISAFETLVDLQAISEMWKEVFKGEEIKILLTAITIYEREKIHPFNSLIKALEKAALKKQRISDLYHAIIQFLKIKNFFPYISAFSKRVDFFGDHRGKCWLKKIARPENVYLHWSLAYSQHFEVLKKSKIHLFFRPHSLETLDEWFFPSVCNDCLPLIQTHRGQEEKYREISFETPLELQNKIDYYLNNSKARLEMLQRLKQDCVSWDTCANILMQEISSEASISHR